MESQGSWTSHVQLSSIKMLVTMAECAWLSMHPAGANISRLNSFFSVLLVLSSL